MTFARCSLIPLSCLLAVCSTLTPAHAENLTWETETFRFSLSPMGFSLEFVDLTDGTNYCDLEKKTPFAGWVTGDPRGPRSSYGLTSARRSGDILTLQFGRPGREADFRVTTHARRIEFELTAVRDAEGTLQELHFATIPLTLSGDPNAPFAVSPLALNLETNCREIPGYAATLSGATAYRKFGLVGAAFAIIGCPSADLRDALKEAVSETDAIPDSAVGGPWALDAPINHQSYFLDTSGRVNEETVGDWIEMLNGLGVKQLDLHGGYAFRWGDYEPNPKEYPRGRDSLKAVVDRLHEAGIAVGLHTYAMFIAKDAPWVTPIPHPGLAKHATFTLAADVTADATTIPVLEDTAAMSPLTGFHHRNSATIQIGDELIVFSGVSKEPPYAFTGCERGACGTAPASHAGDSKVFNLKECFGLFAPDPDSELFDLVIEETARTYNECGFDMMYMDALDGSDVIDLEGKGHFAWYYGAKFTWELFKKLDNPPLMEMSTFGHHLWSVRSRMGAWDACQRAPQTFADIHVLNNAEWKRHFLPTNLGWWGIFPWSGVQPKRSLPDDVAYICTKAVGTDSSLSLLLGFSPKEYPKSHQQQRLGEIIRRHEEVRLAGVIPPAVREKISQPGEAFRLAGETPEEAHFLPLSYARQDVDSSDGGAEWTVENPFAAQAPEIRIEHFLSIDSPESDKAEVMEDFSDGTVFAPAASKEGVTASFQVGEEPSRDGGRSGLFVAMNSEAEPHRAWVAVEREFDPPLNLKNRGLGLWVHGDGQGAVLNLQIRSPKHTTPGLTEHYTVIDFEGWRYVELIESEDYDIEKYEWPYAPPRLDWMNNIASAMGFAYPLYHSHLDYGQIGGLKLVLNNLPKGKEVRVALGEIRTLPHKTSKLTHPSLTVNETTVVFPVTLESGQMLETVPPSTFTVVDAKGELVSEGELETELPVLKTGSNSVRLKSEGSDDLRLHSRVTLTTAGPALTP